jgi:hypothetical protein
MLINKEVFEVHHCALLYYIPSPCMPSCTSCFTRWPAVSKSRANAYGTCSNTLYCASRLPIGCRADGPLIRSASDELLSCPGRWRRL